MYPETEVYSIPENFELTEENIKNCDYVFTMRCVNIYPNNIYSDDVVFSVIKNYKGEMTVYEKVLPKRAGFEKRKVYLVFMVKPNEESIQLAAYNGAVICEDDENYSKALELVKSIFGEQN